MKRALLSFLFGGIAVVLLVHFSTTDPIPRTWNMTAIRSFHLSPPDSTVKVDYAPEAYYYALPQHIIYRTYPVYVRETERRGYLDSLRMLDPVIEFDAARLKTPQDWIDAGE